jgi:hypothetical protein
MAQLPSRRRGVKDAIHGGDVSMKRGLWPSG